MNNNEYTNSMMRRGLSPRNPKPRLFNIHKDIEKSENKLGRTYVVREVIEPKVREGSK